MSLHYLPALAAESLGESSTAGEPSVPLKSTTTVAGYSCSARMMESLSHSQSGLTLPNSTGDLGLDAWILSLADSRAKTSVQQDAAPALPENAQDSGPKWYALLAKYNPDTSSWKTPQCSLFEDSEPSLEIWPRWGSLRNGVAYRRQKPAHLISGTASGLWPTPTVCGNHNRKGASKTSGDGLATAVGGFLKATELPDLDARNAVNSNRMWQTPVADDAVDRKHGKFNSRGEPKLSAQVMRPTPTATQHKGWSPKHNRADTDDRLDYSVERESFDHGQQTPPMRLNPEWVEYLMGWPIGWTDLKPLGMDKFREWLQQHGKR